MGYAEQAAHGEIFGRSVPAWHGRRWRRSTRCVPARRSVSRSTGQPIALFRIGDDVYATDGICPHAMRQLADGYMEGETIECPLHQALFDIRTGKVLAGPATESLRVYPVKVAGGDVLVELGGTEPAREAPAATAMAPRDGGLQSDSPRTGNGAPENSDMTSNGGAIRPATIRVARQRSHRHPRLGLHRPVHLRARGGKDLPRPHLELRGARSRGAECRRFHPLQCGSDAGRGGAGGGRLDQRGRESLPAPRRRVLPRAQRYRQGIRLPLSPVDL